MSGSINNERENYEKRIVELLTSSNDDVVISMLSELKNEDNLFVVEPILDILSAERSNMLKRAIVEFASEIKNPKAVDSLSNYLTNWFTKRRVVDVCTICWQCRLDFSSKLPVFFDILIRGDYQTAFEAFTVIENSLCNLTTLQLQEFIQLVKGGIAKSDRDKQLLLLEMISVLEKAKREIL